MKFSAAIYGAGRPCRQLPYLSSRAPFITNYARGMWLAGTGNVAAVLPAMFAAASPA
ncbi:hypothetical protein PY650_35765 [Rhizobium calliandrae]|uniref:Uncharacterized protein n=1 Tax=Rhizobium calliandrae TaxID=1312182 RepID=A0ABT7KRV9_9HYPH|nr:hypothetical protein [Rhizobium calliandrae]MDL2410808.1 hypothetical protein [Rhizobium calliandrae]